MPKYVFFFFFNRHEAAMINAAATTLMGGSYTNQVTYCANEMILRIGSTNRTMATVFIQKSFGL